MSSTFSVGGLTSGLDTDSIVSQLMAVERIPVTQMQSRQSALRAVDTAWSGIVTKMSAIRTALDDLDQTSDYATHSTVSSSNESAVKVTRTGAPAVGGLSFTVTRLAQAYQGSLSGATSLTSGSDSIGDGTIRVKHADGASYTDISTDGKTLDQVASALSQHADLDVNATVATAQDGSKRLIVSSRRVGADGGLQFDLSGAPSSLNASTQLYAAQDAQLTMGSDGDTVVVTSPTNRITNLIAGVTVDLRAATTSPVTVEVQRDTAVTTEKVRALVDAINSALTELDTKTAYNADAGTAGALQGDATARALRQSLASVLSNAVGGATGSYTSGTSIGIEVDRQGKLTLDETKLQQALDEAPDLVADLLAGDGGLMAELDAVLSAHEGSTGLIRLARDGLSEQISTYDDQIAAYEDRLDLRESMLRRKFSGLESALSVIQAQGANLLAALQ